MWIARDHVCPDHLAPLRLVVLLAEVCLIFLAKQAYSIINRQQAHLPLAHGLPPLPESRPLTAGYVGDVQVRYKQPVETGGDRAASLIAAMHDVDTAPQPFHEWDVNHIQGPSVLDCPDGFALTNEKTCVLMDFRMPEETCPYGTFRHSSGNHCVQIDSVPPDRTCSAGFEYFMRGCIRRTQISPLLTCPPGYTQIEGLCYSASSVPPKITCNSGTQIVEHVDPTTKQATMSCKHENLTVPLYSCGNGGRLVTAQVTQTVLEQRTGGSVMVSPKLPDCAVTEEIEPVLSCPSGFELLTEAIGGGKPPPFQGTPDTSGRMENVSDASAKLKPTRPPSSSLASKKKSAKKKKPTPEEVPEPSVKPTQKPDDGHREFLFAKEAFNRTEDLKVETTVSTFQCVKIVDYKGKIVCDSGYQLDWTGTAASDAHRDPYRGARCVFSNEAATDRAMAESQPPMTATANTPLPPLRILPSFPSLALPLDLALGQQTWDTILRSKPATTDLNSSAINPSPATLPWITSNVSLLPSSIGLSPIIAGNSILPLDTLKLDTPIVFPTLPPLSLDPGLRIWTPLWPSITEQPQQNFSPIADLRSGMVPPVILAPPGSELEESSMRSLPPRSVLVSQNAPIKTDEKDLSAVALPSGRKAANEQPITMGVTATRRKPQIQRATVVDPASVLPNDRPSGSVLHYSIRRLTEEVPANPENSTMHVISNEAVVIPGVRFPRVEFDRMSCNSHHPEHLIWIDAVVPAATASAPTRYLTARPRIPICREVHSIHPRLECPAQSKTVCYSNDPVEDKIGSVAGQSIDSANNSTPDASKDSDQKRRVLLAASNPKSWAVSSLTVRGNRRNNVREIDLTAIAKLPVSAAGDETVEEFGQVGSAQGDMSAQKHAATSSRSLTDKIDLAYILGHQQELALQACVQHHRGRPVCRLAATLTPAKPVCAKESQQLSLRSMVRVENSTTFPNQHIKVPMCVEATQEPPIMECPFGLGRASNTTGRCDVLLAQPLSATCPEGFTKSSQERQLVPLGLADSKKIGGNKKIATQPLETVIPQEGVCELVEYADYQITCPAGYKRERAKNTAAACVAEKLLPPAIICPPGYLPSEGESTGPFTLHNPKACTKQIIVAPTIVSYPTEVTPPHSQQHGNLERPLTGGMATACVLTKDNKLSCGVERKYHGVVDFPRQNAFGQAFKDKMDSKGKM